MTTYFCDGLKDVTIVNGVARLEFHRLEIVERGGDRELRPVSEFSVALPVQGFVNALEVPGIAEFDFVQADISFGRDGGDVLLHIAGEGNVAKAVKEFEAVDEEIRLAA